MQLTAHSVFGGECRPAGDHMGPTNLMANVPLPARLYQQDLSSRTNSSRGRTRPLGGIAGMRGGEALRNVPVG
jgi:hypothetical protein